MGSCTGTLVIFISLMPLLFWINTVKGQDETSCKVTQNKRTGHYSIAKRDLKQLFAKAFKTRTQLKNETNVPVSPYSSLLRTIQSSYRGPNRGRGRQAAPCPMGYRGDDDCCCPTCRYYTKYTQVNDTSGTQWYVVHFPDDGMYQWVEVGMCGLRMSSTCRRCIQEYNFQSVLVSYEDPDSDATALSISYVQVAFPAYCKCSCGHRGPPGLPGPPGPTGPPGPHIDTDIRHIPRRSGPAEP